MKRKNYTITVASRYTNLLLILAFLTIGQTLFAQTKKVTGIVKDITGETIIGASVIEKGTTNGTITDVDGNFVLNVNLKTTILQISYVGYQTQDVNISDQTSITIILKEDSEMLEEVVVVGYGAQKKKVSLEQFHRSPRKSY